MILGIVGRIVLGAGTWAALTPALMAQPGATPAPPSSSPTPSTAVFTGTVRWAGPEQTFEPFEMPRSGQNCSPTGLLDNDRNDIVANGGLLRNAFVWFPNLEPDRNVEPDRTARPPRITAENCRLTPRMVVVRAGQNLDFLARERGTLSLLVEGPLGIAPTQQEIALGTYGQLRSLRLRQMGFYRVTSPSHPWLSAHAVVPPSAFYAVTNGSGAFTIPGLPLGRHKVAVWHGGLGHRVRRSGERVVDFEFDPPVYREQFVTLDAGENRPAALELP